MKTLQLLIMASVLWIGHASLAESRIILPTTSGAEKFFGEFSLAGNLIRKLGSFPAGTRDYTPDAQGNLHTYTGTFTPNLMSQQGNTWKTQTFPGWSTANNLSYGGIAAIGTDVYVSDMYTAYEGSPSGIIRFGTREEIPVRFAESLQTFDLATDGTYLYALAGYSWISVHVFDPGNMQYVRTFPINEYGLRSIALKQNGELFTANWDGTIKHYTSEGTLLDSLVIPGIRFSDINIDDESGNIVLGAAYGQGIFLTDESLDTYHQFTVTDQALRFDTEFVSFQVVPEPSTIVLGGMVATGLLFIRKRL